MSRTTNLSAYLTDGTHSATTGGSAGSKYVQIPASAIGLPESDIDDFGEFVNALLRTAAAKYEALTGETRPEHFSLARSTYHPSSSETAQRTYTVALDIAFSGESVVDEAGE